MPKPTQASTEEPVINLNQQPVEKPAALAKNKQTLKVRRGKSALSQFVARTMPTEEETEKFEEYVHEEIREHEITEGLSKIYQDDKSGADVNTIKKTPRRALLDRILRVCLTLVVAMTAVWVGYYFLYLKGGGGQSAVNLSITADKEVPAGKEFFYTVTYRNFDSIDIKNLTIDLTYPDNFIFLEATPAPIKDTNSWKFDQLGVRRSGEIKIKGKLIGETGSQAIILGNLTYTPANFSSEFKKEASYENHISITGLIIKVENSSSALVNELTEVAIKYRAETDNYLPNFRVALAMPENLELEKPAKENPAATSSLPGVWLIGDAGAEEKTLTIKFKFKDKLDDTQDLNLRFEYSEDGQKYYPFLVEKLTYEVMKRDLNLNLIINGERVDQGVDFSETLNYSIVFNNKGKTAMSDVVIMAVLESDFLDWNTLIDRNRGQIIRNTLSWSKNELPLLANLAPASEGTIDFSIKLKPAGDIDPTKNYQVKSFAQFSVGGVPFTDTSGATSTSDLPAGEGSPRSSLGEAGSGRSNIIINKINSDINLNEQVRYFSDDNIAVGSGPLPPKVGETTSYKIYWTLTNNLNELTDVKVVAQLPPGVTFDQKSRTTLGTIDYDQTANKVTWNLGRLPITVYKSEAEFNLSVKPTAADLNKIIVLLSGTEITAADNVTNSPITKKLKAKTSKLDDDPVATDDGRVVQ